MNNQRAEKMIQLASILGIWVAFGSVWLVTPSYVALHHKEGVGCGPMLALWFAVGESGISFLAPAALTVVLIWLMLARSRHANWTAGAILCLGLFYVVGANLAATLPMYSLCRAV